MQATPVKQEEKKTKALDKRWYLQYDELDFEKRVTNQGFLEFGKVIGDYSFEIVFTD